MPTLIVTTGYRFYFFSHEPGEPPHIHVEGSGHSAKFWLGEVICARNYGFSPVELRKIERIIRVYRNDFLRKWNEFFNRRR
ncbi:DUF4160 domain-containing protein [Massilia cavernae]|uniref:DUF4160 domain-containing protein n=1 Tax=Massilia cavernae TaxID=2320864 RepID=A0A418X7E9_9BURK|nr:DUF4160 domain-containing protein [Massilia cavernae]RJG08435.1 DUF4160 domain-containing protein [Massilia cavernae]